MKQYCVLVIFSFLFGAYSQSAHADDATDAAATKAYWDAKSAEADYYAKALSASAKAGSATSKDGAGQMEASVLAAKTLENLAHEIADKVKTVGSHPIVVMNGDTDPSFANAHAFEIRSDEVKRALDKAIENQPSDTSIMAVAGAALAVGAVAQIASLLKSDYEVGGRTTSLTSFTLQVAIAGKLAEILGTSSRVYVLQQMANSQTSRAVVEKLGRLSELAYKATQFLATATAKAKAYKDQKNDAEAKKWSAAADDLTSAINGYSAFIAALTGDKATLPLAKVLAEKAAVDVLASGGYELFVDLAGQGGSYYSKSNLWTFFGALPFNISGGAVVGYVLIDSADGHVVAGGLKEGTSGFIGITDVKCTIESNCLSSPRSGIDQPGGQARHSR